MLRLLQLVWLQVGVMPRCGRLLVRCGVGLRVLDRGIPVVVGHWVEWVGGLRRWCHRLDWRRGMLRLWVLMRLRVVCSSHTASLLAWSAALLA